MDIITLYLKLAFKQPGCPICRLCQESEKRYLFGLLWENVTDGTTRLRLVRSLGFCPEHLWALQATEQQEWHDGMGTGIIYEDLTGRVLNTLKAYLAQPAPPPRTSTNRPERWFDLRRVGKWLEQRGRTGRWLARRLLALPLPGAPLLAQLSPRVNCPACELVDGAEETNLNWLVRNCTSAEFRGWYAASDGLCLPHLRLALARAEDEATVHFLTQVAVDKLTPLLTDLQEYGRKHIWDNRHEPKYAWEQSSWLRAVAFFGGEAPQGVGEPVEWARRQALLDYRTRPQEWPDSEHAALPEQRPARDGQIGT